MFKETMKKLYTDVNTKSHVVAYDKEMGCYAATNGKVLLVQQTQDQLDTSKYFNIISGEQVNLDKEWVDWKAVLPRTVHSKADLTGATLYQVKTNCMNDQEFKQLIVFKDGKKFNAKDLWLAWEFCGQDADMFFTKDEDNSPLCMRSQGKTYKAIIPTVSANLDNFVDQMSIVPKTEVSTCDFVYVLRGPNNFMRIFKDESTAKAYMASHRDDTDLTVHYIY